MALTDILKSLLKKPDTMDDAPWRQETKPVDAKEPEKTKPSNPETNYTASLSAEYELLREGLL